jgi:hypothetical protein
MLDRRNFLGFAANAVVVGGFAVPAIAAAQASDPSAAAGRKMTGSPPYRRRPPMQPSSVTPTPVLDGPLQGGSPSNRGRSGRAARAQPASASDAGVTVADAGVGARTGATQGARINPAR